MTKGKQPAEICSLASHKIKVAQPPPPPLPELSAFLRWFSGSKRRCEWRERIQSTFKFTILIEHFFLTCGEREREREREREGEKKKTKRKQRKERKRKERKGKENSTNIQTLIVIPKGIITRISTKQSGSNHSAAGAKKFINQKKKADA